MTNDDGYEAPLNTDELNIDITANPFETNDELEQTKKELFIAKTEIRELNFALKMLKDFVIENGLDVASIGFNKNEKPLEKTLAELTPEEIIQRNGMATQRQAGKHAISDAALPQPTYDELEKMYKERIKENHEAGFGAQTLVDMFLEKTEEKKES